MGHSVDHHEVEWQFDAEDLETVAVWLRRHSSGTGLAVEPEPEEEITDTYYDAEDWRFYRAGYALRVREVNGEAEATMKSISPAEGVVRRRREITEPIGNVEPAALNDAPGPVGERARSLLGGRQARGMFEVRTHRRKFALLLERPADRSENGAPGKGVRIGEVALDLSEIPLDGGGEPVRISRVEVEAGAGTAPTPGLRDFVDEMQHALDLVPAPLSKFETGLYAAGLTPDGGDGVGPTEIGPAMSLGGVAFAVLRRQFAEMRAHEPGTRIGEDPEELHDMRVATRRMRAAMKVFEAALPERARWLREELRWLAGPLGDVRDLDVQIERLAGWRDGDDGEGLGPSLGRILGLLEKRRAEARGRMLAALDSDRYGRLESSFGEMLRRGPGAERELARADDHPAADEPVTSGAPALISDRHRKWRKAARRLDGSSPPDDFHDVRKKGKRLRYALEFVSEVYGGERVKPLIKPLKALQDDLGDHQDAVVAAETLRELGTTTGGPRIPRDAVFAMGVLSERYRRAAADERAAVLRSKPLRALLKGKAWKDFEKAAADAAREGCARGERVRRGGALTSVDLILVRHAAAHDRDPELWPDDSLRPLTREGEEAFRVAAGGLSLLAPRVDVLLSSPFERAWRTAEVLAELDGWPDPEPSTPLEPTLPPEKAAGALGLYEGADVVAVVGHRPCLHELASYLLTGEAAGADITIKKGGVLCVRFDGAPAPGAGRLRWLATPKILRALGS